MSKSREKRCSHLTNNSCKVTCKSSLRYFEVPHYHAFLDKRPVKRFYFSRQAHIHYSELSSAPGFACVCLFFLDNSSLSYFLKHRFVSNKHIDNILYPYIFSCAFSKKLLFLNHKVCL